MAQTQKPSTESKRTSRPTTRKPSSILKEDHEKVLKMFKDYEKLKSDSGTPAKKQELAYRICEELKVHTQVEEELYYPRVREATDKDSLLNEAQVEHASAEDLIKQIESMSPDDRLFDAKVKVLGEYVQHHIKEEQDEMFPLAKKAEVDTAELGQQLLERKEELKRKLH